MTISTRYPPPFTTSSENTNPNNIMSVQMKTALWYKFNQNNQLKRELLSTGDAELIEVTVAPPREITVF